MENMSFGDICFTLTADQIKVMEDIKSKRSARFVEHIRLSKKPLLQFMGENNEEISFFIQLHDSLGIDVEQELNILNKMIKEGRAYPLFMGNKKLGNFVIESVNTEILNYNNIGKVMSAVVYLNIKEYVK